MKKHISILLVFAIVLLSGCYDPNSEKDSSSKRVLTGDKASSLVHENDVSKPEGAPGYDPDALPEITSAREISPIPMENIHPQNELVTIEGIEFIVRECRVSNNLDGFSGLAVNELPLLEETMYLFVDLTITNPGKNDFSLNIGNISADEINGNQPGYNGAGGAIDYSGCTNAYGHDYYWVNFTGGESRNITIVFYTPANTKGANQYLTFDSEGSGEINSSTQYISLSPIKGS